MKIIVESTTKTVTLNGVPMRIWEGETETGIKIHCYITRVALMKGETRLLDLQLEISSCILPSPEIYSLPNQMTIKNTD